MSSATAEAASRLPSTLERVLQDFRAQASQGIHGSQGAQNAARERAALEFTRLGWPSTRDEQWRYANLRAIEQLPSFQPVAPAAPAQVLAAPSLPPPLPGFTRLVFLDATRQGAVALPEGVESVAARDLHAIDWPGSQRLGWLGEMFGNDAAAWQIHGEAALELLFVTTGAAAGRAAYPRLQLRLLPGSRLQLVERHLGGAAAPSLVASSARIELARGASLQHYRLQQYDSLVVVSDSLDARVEDGAQYRVHQFALGAHSTRTSARVSLAGREASVQWHAIAVGRGEQVHDVALQVLHEAGATRSEQSYRGIADERARLAFSSHVHIGAQAPGSEARQSLRGLIEGAAAEIDLRPRLEIHIDEVRASHGATTGRLDENLLFYLLARGIDRATARALLKWAFLGDLLREIALPALRLEVERLAAGQLPDVLAVGAVA